MTFSKKDKEVIGKAIAYWKSKDMIDESIAEKLSDSIPAKNFDWKSLAYYTSIFALISLIIAVISIFADKALLKFIDSIIDSSFLTKSIVGLLISILFYFLDLRFTKDIHTKKSYSQEVFALLSAISLAITTGFICYLIGKEESPGLIIFCLTIIYLTLGKVHQKAIYWFFGLAALVIAFGTFTITNEILEGSFWGMNLSLRFSLFGLILIAISVLLRTIIKPFYKYTYNSAIIIFFTATWILSITGNYHDYEVWLAVRQYELWGYSLLLFIASIISILIGIKKEDSWLKNTGVLFVCVNLYTRYFEYFWDSMHKAIFFFIIALSFWVIAKQAERIWNKKT